MLSSNVTKNKKKASSRAPLLRSPLGYEGPGCIGPLTSKKKYQGSNGYGLLRVGKLLVRKSIPGNYLSVFGQKCAVVAVPMFSRAKNDDMNGFSVVATG